MKVSNEDKGILAALSAPFFMALGFITWENVWTKRGSAFSLNLFKCNMASILFLILGLIFGFTVENDYDENSKFESGGSILTKVYGAKFTTWGINLIRFGSSGTFLIFVSVIMRLLAKRHSTAEKYEVFNKASWYRLPSDMSYQDWSKVSLGVVFVTFLCPALSNYALFQIALALALTLGSITPVYALILEWAILPNERPTLRAIIGASLAVAGVAVLSIFKNAR